MIKINIIFKFPFVAMQMKLMLNPVWFMSANLHNNREEMATHIVHIAEIDREGRGDMEYV